MTALLTAAEVADMLGMTTDWVYAETRAGRIPHVELGRYRRYRRESIEEWLAEMERGSVAPEHKAPPRRANGRGHGTEEVSFDATRR
jgi:excisionase family DNA binding protein